MAGRRTTGTRYLGLSESGVAKTGAVMGFLTWLVGVFWHGGLGQPSMMGLLYNMPYTQPMFIFTSFLGLVVGGFLIGWIGAYVYNWTIRSN